MRALNETSEAQQAGDTIVPDRAAFRREACQLEYEYQEPSAETASGRARTPPSISPGGAYNLAGRTPQLRWSIIMKRIYTVHIACLKKDSYASERAHSLDKANVHPYFWKVNIQRNNRKT